ncbi:hypothetical protein KC356_g272 [Hortaea werneckii]|nr:hypothetical protein KC356_g272 [Hortaea werneckii]
MRFEYCRIAHDTTLDCQLAVADRKCQTFQSSSKKPRASVLSNPFQSMLRSATTKSGCPVPVISDLTYLQVIVEDFDREVSSIEDTCQIAADGYVVGDDERPSAFENSVHAALLGRLSSWELRIVHDLPDTMMPQKKRAVLRLRIDRDTLGIFEKQLMPIAVQRGLSYGIPTRIHCSPKSVGHIVLNRRVPRDWGSCNDLVRTMREGVPGSLASIRVDCSYCSFDVSKPPSVPVITTPGSSLHWARDEGGRSTA